MQSVDKLLQRKIFHYWWRRQMLRGRKQLCGPGGSQSELTDIWQQINTQAHSLIRYLSTHNIRKRHPRIFLVAFNKKHGKEHVTVVSLLLSCFSLSSLLNLFIFLHSALLSFLQSRVSFVPF
jgi:hypothetical protein